MTDWQFVLILVSLVSALVTLWLAEMAWRCRRDVRGAGLFTVYMLLGTTWTLLNVGEVAAGDPTLLLLVSRLKHAVAGWVPLALLAFVLYFLNSEGRWPRPMWALVLLPVLNTAMALFNVGQNYYLDETVTTEAGVQVMAITPGPLFSVFLGYAYLYVALALVLLIWGINRLPRPRAFKRGMTAALLVVAAVIVLATAPLALGETQIDLSPISVSLFGLVLGFGLLRLRLFDLMPVAYDNVLANVPDGVLTIDLNQRVLSLNPSVTALTGVTNQRAQGQPMDQAFPELAPYCEPDDPNAESTHEIELKESIVEVRTLPLRDTRGTTRGRLLVLHDITERRRSEERYRLLFDRATDAIMVIGTPGETIIEVNRAATHMFGYAEDALVGKQLRDLQVNTRREEKTEASKPRFEVNVQHGDGGTITVELTLAPLTQGHDTHLLLAIARDITARKQAEAALNERINQLQILRQVGDEIGDTLDVQGVLLISLDAALRLSHANAGFIVLLADSRIMSLQTIGAYAEHDGQVPIDLERGVLGRVLENKTSEYIRNVDTDDDYTPSLPGTQSQIVVPLVSRDSVIGLLNLETNDRERFSEEVFQFMRLLADRIAVAMDNARLYKQAQDQIVELKTLYEQVSDLEQLKTDMIRIAAHDLRNPVSVLVGYLEIFELDIHLFDAEYQDYIKQMLKSVRRINAIIDDILSLERIERMADQSQGEPFDLGDKVNAALKEYHKQVQAKGLTLRYKPLREPVHVTGDASQMYEAITNLISNAIKYTPEDGTITVALAWADDGHVTYTVTDTGYGIPQEQQERLFQPFFRASSQETRKIEGTGLGLHLVKNIVERHSGKIVFSSVYGEGSTFGFTLPVKADEPVG